MTARRPLAALLFSALLLSSFTAKAYEDDMRTAARVVHGRIVYPSRIFNKPEFYEFTPLVSNHDVQNTMASQWDGQDWDTSAWNDLWTPDVAVKKLFENGTFTKQSTRGKSIAVLNVGPTFYQLSDLDRRRSLKLVADTSKLFDSGFALIELRDWHTNKVVGSYSPKGMYLN